MSWIDWHERLKHLPPTLVGFAKRRSNELPGKPLQNAAALLRDGKVETVFTKSLLPTYDVFDEHRYFEPGQSVETFELDGKTIAVTICEDIWNDGELSRWSSYAERPLDALETTPVDLIVNLSASPYTISKAYHSKADSLRFEQTTEDTHSLCESGWRKRRSPL